MTQSRQIGLWLAILLGVVDIATTFVPVPTADGEGPSMFVVVLGLILGHSADSSGQETTFGT